MIPFNIDSIENKSLQSDLNTSFKSLDQLIASYTPATTEQDFEIFYYYGTLQNGFEQKLDFEPLAKTDVFGQANSFMIKVGYIETDGTFKAELLTDFEEVVFLIFQAYRVKRL